MSNFRTAKTAKTCNVFPSVWAAIVGCTGSGRNWRHAPAHFGTQAVEYACDTCRAAKERLDALVGLAHTAELERLRTAAGVADYRTAEVVVRDGRPVLTGKVDVHLAREAAENALYQAGERGGAQAAAKALRVYAAAGGDCRALVAASKLPSRTVEAVRAAWRQTAA